MKTLIIAGVYAEKQDGIVVYDVDLFGQSYGTLEATYIRSIVIPLSGNAHSKLLDYCIGIYEEYFDTDSNNLIIIDRLHSLRHLASIHLLS